MLACAKPTFINAKKLFKQNKTAFLGLVIIALILVIGLFSAIDKSRSLLMVLSVLFLLSLVAAGWWYLAFELKKSAYLLIINFLLLGGVAYSLLGIGQFMLGSFSDTTLGIACQGCVSDIFGFPRVNLFAAEPQFFANALLPFWFTALAVFYKKGSHLALVALALTTLTIGLTFSRGAYIAVLAGSLSLIAILFFAKKIIYKKVVAILVMLVAAGLASFGMMIASASWRYRSTPNITYDTTRSILEHVSLGVFKLPVRHQSPSVSQTATKQLDSKPFVSPGLIEASTNDRLSAAKLALKAWQNKPLNVLVGVGAGNLGPYVVKNIDSSAPNNLTVYIYYVLILAEIGLFGLGAFLAIYLSVMVGLTKLRGNDILVNAVLLSLMVAFLVQYCFFGTYINTVYIWLAAGGILGFTKSKHIA